MINNDVALVKKVMNLEFKLQEAMRREKYYGKGSTTCILHKECNSLWLEIESRQKRKSPFKVQGGPKQVSPVTKPYNPYH